MATPTLRITSLHARIAVLFVLLILVVQGLGFVVIRSIIAANARSTVEAELSVTERVFQQVLRSNREKLTQAATITAADFGFRKAVASDSRATVESALANQADRIKANISMLVSLDGVLLADSGRPERDGQPFLFPRLLQSARHDGMASGLGIIDGQLYQLVAVPVKAPLAIAWVTMGFRIDDDLALEMRGLTSADVSFLGLGGSDRQSSWTVLASSLPAGSKEELRERFARGDAQTEHTSTIALGGDDYTTRTVAIDSDGSTVVAVLQRSLQQAMAPFSRLQSALLVLTLIGLAVSVLASLFTARSVTRPIADLIRSTRRIGAGEYSGAIEVDSDDEIGELAQAFNQMREGISEREGRIMHLAYRDPLTGLPNRALFNDRLAAAIDQALAEGRPLSLMMIDLDRFKYVNDTLGHHIGDLLLGQVGARMRALVPSETATVARLGGDEFAILLPAETLATACAIATQLLKELETPIVVEGQVVDVSGSIGIVSCPENGSDVNTLFRHADVAMYAAKRNNSGFAVYDASEDQHSAERLSLMTELRQAVEEDELTLYYQPKIDLASGSVKYVEALVRWIHPTRGIVPPDSFIPFAEQTGYIKTITRWVVDRALHQCALWQEVGIELAVSVNVSARDLVHSDLVEVLSACLAKYRLAPHKVWIEITESALMDDPVHAIETLDRLNAAGVHLSIDDFGTGYSSLTYLKRMPVEEIKIDKSFVLGMASDREDETIVRSTIDLGHNMGLKVVAEGVESLEVLGQLRALGCDLAQGFYLSRPLPPAALEAWLRNWDARTVKPAPIESQREFMVA
jgi:diguanylate cyclase (GGDEF)-like protein